MDQENSFQWGIFITHEALHHFDGRRVIILVVVIVVTVTWGVVPRSHFLLVSDILLAAYPGVL